MKVFSLAILLSLMMGGMASTVSAEIDTLNKPSWRKIPGSEIQNASPEFSGLAAVNLNSIIRRKDIVTYDLAEVDGNYYRMQTNCKTYQSRDIRIGYFESSSRVNFTSRRSPWKPPMYPRNRAIALFVCK
jgi:hypothetical protein